MKVNSFGRTRLALIAGGSALAMASAAHAQSTAAPEPAAAVAPQAAADDMSGVGEIIVTAQRRAESVNRVGISITAMSGDQLRDMNVKDVADLAHIVPGFTEAKSAGGTPIYTIRGIGFNTDSMSATSPVGIYVDEVAYAYPYMSSNVLFDLERVEVLKGPQGTLYGRNTTGGLVNFVAAKPTDAVKAGMSLEYGNYQSYEATGYLSGGLTPTLKARIAFKFDGRERGWQHSVTRDDTLGKASRQAARATLLWEPDSNLTATLTGSFWRDNSDTQAAQATIYAPQQPAFGNPLGATSVLANPKGRDADWTALSYPGPFPNGYTRPPFEVHANFYAVSARVGYHLDDNHEIISLTGYNDVDRKQMTDKGGTRLETAGRYADGSIKSFSQEFRVTGEDGPAKWLVGAYYGRDKVKDTLVGFDDDMSIIGLLRFVGASVPSSYTPSEIATGFRAYQAIIDIKDQTFGLFGNIDYALTDQLKLIGGIRYTKEKQTFVGCSADFMGNTAPIWNTALAVITGTNVNLQPNQCLTYKDDFSGASGPVRIKLNEDNLSIKGSLNYAPNSHTLLYVTVAQGYKAGAFPFSSANVVQQLLPAKQEKVRSYEAGAKLGLFDRRLQANFAGYYYDYRNKQLSARVFDPVFGTLQRLVNVPKSFVYGFEAELNARITDALTIRASGNYLHTETKSFQAFTLAGSAADFTGEAFQLSPKWTGSGSLNYQQPVSGTLGLGFNLAANYQSRSKGALESNPLLAIKGRTLVDASLFAYTLDDKWKLSLWGKNIFNKYYWTNTDSEQDTFIRFAGMTRTYGLTVSATF